MPQVSYNAPGVITGTAAVITDISGSQVTTNTEAKFLALNDYNAGFDCFTNSLDYSKILHGNRCTAAVTDVEETGALIVRYNLTLDKLVPESILAINKDIYFGGESVYLKIIWDSVENFTASALCAATPTLSSARFTNTKPTIYNVSNLSLDLAVEQVEAIKQSTINLTNSGSLSYLFDQMFIENKSLSGINHYIDSTKYNRGHGLRLKKIYWVPTHNWGTVGDCLISFPVINTLLQRRSLTETTIYNTNLPISYFYTTLNNNRLTQQNLSISELTPYNYERHRLKGSVLNNWISYYKNFAYCEDFTDTVNYLELPKPYAEQNLVNGIDLNSGELRWGLNVVTADPAKTINHYIIAITQRRLTITKNMITIE